MLPPAVLLFQLTLLLVVIVAGISLKNLLDYITAYLACIPLCKISVVALLQVDSHLVGYFIFHLFERRGAVSVVCHVITSSIDIVS